MFKVIKTAKYEKLKRMEYDLHLMTEKYEHANRVMVDINNSQFLKDVPARGFDSYARPRSGLATFRWMENRYEKMKDRADMQNIDQEILDLRNETLASEMKILKRKLRKYELAEKDKNKKKNC